MQEATIFGRGDETKVTRYQKQVNEAAIDLALHTPSLLSSRQTLLKEARAKVNSDGFIYKKGKSRSKQFSPPVECSPKRVKTSEAFRINRISALEDDIKDLNDRLTFKEKRRDQASSVRNYKACDELTEEMSVIKQQKRAREAELRTLQRKQRKSSWYKQKRIKSKLDPLSSESEGTTPLPSSPTSPIESHTECSSSPRASTSVSSVATIEVNLPSPQLESSHPRSPSVSSDTSTHYTSISTDNSVCSPSHDVAHGVLNTDEHSQKTQHFQ